MSEKKYIDREFESIRKRLELTERTNLIQSITIFVIIVIFLMHVLLPI